jgi:integrase
MDLSTLENSIRKFDHFGKIRYAESMQEMFLERHTRPMKFLRTTAVLKHLPEYLKGFVQFGYLSGWRKSEIASLQWADVDMLGKVIRLRPGHSKNGQRRLLALEGEFWNVIARQWSSRQYKNPDKTIGISALVFHRKGKPIGFIGKSWEPACKAAKVTRSRARASRPAFAEMSSWGTSW